MDQFGCTPTSRLSVSLREAALPLPAEAGSGFEEGRRSTSVGSTHSGNDGSSERLRDSLTSYLHPFSQPIPFHFSSSTPTPTLAPAPPPNHDGPPSTVTDPLTPPPSFSSFTSNLHIARADTAPGMAHSLPLTPVVTPDSSGPSTLELPRSSSTADLCAEMSIPLVTNLFPYQAPAIASISTALEIVTPPAHIVHGFICDYPSGGRTVYVHLSPPAETHTQPETLSANFSEILRPHDPSRGPRESYTPMGMDVRESLTALLDLASDNLEAKCLVLALHREEVGEGLDDTVHSLMYAGGMVLSPGQGALDGGWEWDPRLWVLVGIEL